MMWFCGLKSTDLETRATQTRSDVLRFSSQSEFAAIVTAHPRPSAACMLSVVPEGQNRVEQMGPAL